MSADCGCFALLLLNIWGQLPPPALPLVSGAPGYRPVFNKLVLFKTSCCLTEDLDPWKIGVTSQCILNHEMSLFDLQISFLLLSDKPSYSFHFSTNYLLCCLCLATLLLVDLFSNHDVDLC